MRFFDTSMQNAVLTGLAQGNPPILNPFVLVSMDRGVSIAPLADPKCTTGQRNADTTHGYSQPAIESSQKSATRSCSMPPYFERH
ncbi:MAG: hypothetical protein ACJAR9_001471 [Celeribacter sp.]|jgi:hypothetical protein